MTVLFSELLVPGWAENGDKIGLGAVTGAYGSELAFTLPCHNAEPDLFFSEKSEDIDAAKALCSGCPVREQCLDAALSRNEPCGVWGGELFENGSVIARRRTVGRPRLSPITRSVEVSVEVSVDEPIEVSVKVSEVARGEQRSDAA